MENGANMIRSQWRSSNKPEQPTVRIIEFVGYCGKSTKKRTFCVSGSILCCIVSLHTTGLSELRSYCKLLYAS